MSGEALHVNPAVLDKAGTAFGQAGAGLAGLRSGQPLDAAAAAVTALQTAAACRQARAGLTALITAAAAAVGDYGQKLHTAATRYDTADRAGRNAITMVDLPG